MRYVHLGDYLLCPIHAAIAQRSVSVVKWLISKNADVNNPVLGSRGHSLQQTIQPLHLAVYDPSAEIMRVLCKSNKVTLILHLRLYSRIIK